MPSTDPVRTPLCGRDPLAGRKQYVHKMQATMTCLPLNPCNSEYNPDRLLISNV